MVYEQIRLSDMYKLGINLASGVNSLCLTYQCIELIQGDGIFVASKNNVNIKQSIDSRDVVNNFMSHALHILHTIYIFYVCK